MVQYRNRFGRERKYSTGFEGVIQYVHRKHLETDSDSARDRYEEYMRQIPCPACNGARAEPCVALGADQRQVDRRGRRPADARMRRLPGQPRPHRPRSPDRQPGPQGNPGPPDLPARRRPRVPEPGTALRHAVRRRGPAHPAGHPDRLRPRGRALRPGRALHRPAPAGQPPPDRDAHPAPGPRQHPDRGGARRGHHPGGRLGGGHRTGRRRTRRHGGAFRFLQGTAGEHRIAHWRLPLRPEADRDPEEAAQIRQEARAQGGRAPRRTTS